MFIFRKFIKFTTATLKRFIFSASLIVSIITFITVITTLSWIYFKHSESVSAGMSSSMANRVMILVNEAMGKGKSKSEIAAIIKENHRLLPDNLRITLFTDKAEYGTKGTDNLVRDTFSDGRIHNQQTVALLEHAYPLKAQASCLGCHPSAKAGEVMGVLDIKENTSEFSRSFMHEFIIIFLVFLPIPFLMAFAVSGFVNKHLGHAIRKLDRKIRSVTSIGDLTNLEEELKDEEYRFHEIEAISNEFTEFAGRIKEIAIGRDMMELEIKVLERLIITSETIHDWKARISHLMNEVNAVMKAGMMFCVFQAENEPYNIEVFWSGIPTFKTKQDMDQVIRVRIRRHIEFENTEITIVHNFAENSEFIDCEHAELECQTKSLFLETPQIGGIIGIGVQSQDVANPVHSLVISGILTTMLNVVGSIRAMHVFTKELEHFASRDPLTDLFNQRVFWDLLEYEIGRSERHQDSFGLLVLDLDNFKQVNDMFGHNVGDRFLCEAAKTIQGCLRKGDILSRYGGDEFTVIICEAEEEQVYMVADRIRESLARMKIITGDGTKIYGSASIGMAVYSAHAMTAKDLFLFADNMTYKAKAMGKNCIVIPTSDDVTYVFEKTNEMSLLLMKVIEEKSVIPYFQPIVTAGSLEIQCHEALCRIEDNGRILDASEFIETAERLSIVGRLDRIMMEKVFEKIKQTNYTGLVFLNVSPKSLIVKDFVPTVISLAREYGIQHDHVVFEITERETVKNVTLIERFVRDLKQEGFLFAIDDFGSGYSSFQYIRKLPIDFVKIEGMFVKNMLDDPKDMAFVKTLAVLAKEFGIKTVAEYIEDEELLQAVQGMGIDYVQGYYTGKPMPEFDGYTEGENDPFFRHTWFIPERRVGLSSRMTPEDTYNSMESLLIL